MIRKNLSLVICSLLALAFSSSAFAADAVVPTDFATISAALVGATDVDASGTVEIMVLAGTYPENLFINRSDLALLGEDAATTFIEGSAGIDTVRVENADRVTIKGFTVLGDGAQTGEGTASGIELRRVNDSVVEQNVLHGHRHGVSVNGSHRNSISMNEATGNSGSAIKVQRGLDNQVLANSIHDNFGGGIRVDGAIGTLVDGNTITNNLGDGIRLRRGDEANTLSNNVILGSGGDGIEIRESNLTMVVSNTVSGGANNGMRMRDTSQTLVSLNSFTDNADFGIRRRDGVNDDFNAAVDGVQDPPGDNDLSGNGQGEVRND